MKAPVSELGSIQEAFAAALADVSRVPVAAELFRGPPEEAAQRLAIYRGNVVANARKALANAYPIAARIVGEEFFAGLAREYLRRHPSTSGDLNALGESFADFVAAFPHTQDLPYLPDVARMEWLVHRAHYAKDAEPFDLRRLASVRNGAWARLRPVLAPACAVLESPWPLARIWEVHQDDYSGEFSVDFESGSARILIHRPDFRVRVAPLTPGAFRFLRHAAGGSSVAVALEAALIDEPGFGLPAALHAWVESAVVVDFEAG
jgi:hypothetical protein